MGFFLYIYIFCLYDSSFHYVLHMIESLEPIVNDSGRCTVLQWTTVYKGHTRLHADTQTFSQTLLSDARTHIITSEISHVHTSCTILCIQLHMTITPDCI